MQQSAAENALFAMRRLGSAEAQVAYPLVACRYGKLPLALWTEYVRQAEYGEIPERLVGLVDPKGRFHAIFAYRVEVDRAQRRRLRVLRIATFHLAGDFIQRDFQRALDKLAGDNNCREVELCAWSPPDHGKRDTAPFVGPSGVLSIGEDVEAIGVLN